MISAFLFGNKNGSMVQLSQDLNNFCPQIKIKGKFGESQIDDQLIEKNQEIILFLELSNPCRNIQKTIERLLDQYSTIELICIGDKKEKAYQAYQLHAFQYLLKPYKPKDLINSVYSIEKRFKIDIKLTHTNNQEPVLGIPTTHGYEFIPINEIVRCEGLQSYTKIITKSRKDIISSNNIGELKKKLIPYGFFTPHKSYIISMKQIRRYSKDGIIYLNDGAQVPLARRRKLEFFQKIMLL